MSNEVKTSSGVPKRRPLITQSQRLKISTTPKKPLTLQSNKKLKINTPPIQKLTLSQLGLPTVPKRVVRAPVKKPVVPLKDWEINIPTSEPFSWIFTNHTAEEIDKILDEVT